MPDAYDKGDIARLTATFRDDAGVLINPTALTFKATKPDATTVTYVYGTNVELVRDSTGLYHVDLPLDQSGLWTYTWTSTGTAQGAESGDLEVRPTTPAGLIPTSAEVAALLWARTKDEDGNRTGDFSTTTTPTKAEVESLIRTAVQDVLTRIGAFATVATSLAARRMVVIKTAMLIELSYFPEQIREGQSPYDQLSRLYTEGMDSIDDTPGVTGGGSSVVSVPIYGELGLDPLTGLPYA